MVSANISGLSRRFLTTSIILSVFFHSYRTGIPGISLGELLLIISCLLILFQTKFTISVIKINPLILFLLVSLLTTIVSLLIQQSSFSQVPLFEVVSRLIRYSAYVIFVTIGAKYFDFKFALKHYRMFCTILSVYIILQFFMYYSFHIMLPIKILPLEWMRTYDLEVLLSSMDSGYFRAYGVFAEPGYAAQFLLPGLALALFGWYEKNYADYRTLVLISTAIIVTTSLQGIIIALLTIIMWIIWIILPKKINSQGYIKRIIHIAVIIVVIGTSFGVLSSLGIIDVAISRIEGIGNIYREGGSGSTAIRMFRGWSLFAATPLLYKLIGAGLGNTANFVSDYNISTKYDFYSNTTTALEFTDGISGTLMCTGLIGFLLFIRWILKIFKKIKEVHKMIMVQFIALLFAGTGLFSLTMVFYMGFIYGGYGMSRSRSFSDHIV